MREALKAGLRISVLNVAANYWGGISFVLFNSPQCLMNNSWILLLPFAPGNASLCEGVLSILPIEDAFLEQRLVVFFS